MLNSDLNHLYEYFTKKLSNQDTPLLTWAMIPEQENEQQACWVLSLIARVADQRFSDVVLEALDDSRSEVRHHAFIAFKAIARQQDWKKLIELLHSNSPETRQAAEQIVLQWPYALSSQQLKESINDLIRLLPLTSKGLCENQCIITMAALRDYYYAWLKNPIPEQGTLWVLQQIWATGTDDLLDYIGAEICGWVGWDRFKEWLDSNDEKKVHFALRGWMLWFLQDYELETRYLLWERLYETSFSFAVRREFALHYPLLSSADVDIWLEVLENAPPEKIAHQCCPFSFWHRPFQFVRQLSRLTEIQKNALIELAERYECQELKQHICQIVGQTPPGMGRSESIPMTSNLYEQEPLLELPTLEQLLLGEYLENVLNHPVPRQRLAIYDLLCEEMDFYSRAEKLIYHDEPYLHWLAKLLQKKFTTERETIRFLIIKCLLQINIPEILDEIRYQLTKCAFGIHPLLLAEESEKFSARYRYAFTYGESVLEEEIDVLLGRRPRSFFV